MPFLVTLPSKFEKCEPSDEDILCWVLCLVTNVMRLHSKHIIHLDLKPHNLYLNNNGTNCILIGDFGCAHREDTPVCCFVGTERYVAPELNNDNDDMKNNHPPAHSSMDIYSLGKVIEWMASKKIPQNNTPILQGLCKFARQCTEYDPKERPQSKNLLQELQNCLNGINISTLQICKHTRRKAPNLASKKVTNLLSSFFDLY
jgi:serine/threonine protein kinase